MFTPTIGITDFTDSRQARDMKSVLHRIWNGGPPLARLHVGVMMSYKTFMGLPTKWADVFPKKEDVASIFLNSNETLNVLHYADYNAQDCDLSTLQKAAHLSGPWCAAVQLDVIWPNPRRVRDFRKYAFWGNKVILQVGGNALEEIRHDASALVERLHEYGDGIDGVLLDESMGRGKPMNAARLIPFVDAIRASSGLHRLAITVAGGLGPDTLHLVEPVIERYGGKVSIDAQGRLRPSGDAKDPIDWDMAGRYLKRAAAMYCKHWRP